MAATGISRVVPPEGPVDSPLVLTGRDPGWQEVRDGRPFVGEAGKLLGLALADAGLRRSSLLITNVCGVRPPRDEWGAHAQEEIDEGFAELSVLLRAAERKIIIAFGAQAFWTCATGEAAPRSEPALNKMLYKQFGGSITELRGYMWDGPFGPVLAAVHPAFVLRSWLPWRATLTWDLQKAARWGAGAERPARVSRFARDPQEAAALTAELLAAPILAVDSEEPPDACVAFAASPGEGVSLLWPRDRECIAELLAAPMPKVLQNAQYDLTKFAEYGLTVNGEIHDAMLAWFARDPLIAGKSSDNGSRQSAKSLRFLASVFTDEPYWKNYNFETPEQKAILCATDARVTLEILLQLLPELAACSNGYEQAWSEGQREAAPAAHRAADSGSREARYSVGTI